MSLKDNLSIKKSIRKPYQKLRLEKVSLVIDETILFTGCKTPAGGPNTTPCEAVAPGVTACRETGS
jgi:hypothetical protein